MSSSLRNRNCNRLSALLEHIPRYAFQGQARLARDTGLSRSAISRLMSGQSSPSFAVAIAITRALEKQLGRRIDPREILSVDGTYPTESVCELVGCKGCLPSDAYNDDDTLKPAYKGMKPSRWALAPPSDAELLFSTQQPIPD